jgi:hypothetical protein
VVWLCCSDQGETEGGSRHVGIESGQGLCDEKQGGCAVMDIGHSFAGFHSYVGRAMELLGWAERRASPDGTCGYQSNGL